MARPPRGIADQISRPIPAAPIPGRRVYALTVDDLRPVVRIAHRRVTGPLDIPWRVIVDHEFVLFLKGHGRFEFDDGPVEFRAGQLFLVPPFTPHRILGERGAACDHVAVHFDLARHVPPVEQALTERRPYEVRLPGRLGLPRRTVLRRNDPIQRTLLRLTEARTDHPLVELEASVCVLEVLLELWKRSAPPADAPLDALAPVVADRDQLRVQRAMRFIEANYMHRLSADDLAAAAGMSPSHFNRLFRQWAGHAPMEYLRRHRVAKARELLADVDLSIKEIAHRVGFDDAFHFSKTFHKIDGLSPTQFRDAALTGRTRPAKSE